MTSAAETPAAPSNPDALRAEIEQTRAGLADTVEALAAKLDVKAQVESKVSHAKERVRARADRVTSKVRRPPRRPHASVVRDPTGLDARLDPEVDLTLGAAVEQRRRVTRAQSIVAAGVAGLAVIAVAVWAMRRARR